MRQGVLISTTEHLLSALIGLGIDNVICEIDNLEVPILDGSAQPYVNAIQAAGLKQQRRRREYLRILKPVEVREGEGPDSKFIGVYPGDGYSIDYTIDFPAPIGRDRFTGDLEAGAYADLIAPARTFGFREDEAKLRNMGLIRGATEASPIIIGSGRIQNGPLRFPDEFVREAERTVLDAPGTDDDGGGFGGAADEAHVAELRFVFTEAEGASGGDEVGIGAGFEVAGEAVAADGGGEVDGV